MPSLDLSAIDVSIPLAEIYRDVLSASQPDPWAWPAPAVFASLQRRGSNDFDGSATSGSSLEADRSDHMKPGFRGR